MSIDDLPNYKGYFYDPISGRMFKEIPTFRYDSAAGRSVPTRPERKQSTHLIFRIMTGRWPNTGMQIDHKNGKTENTQWNNLREATPRQNRHNTQPWKNEKTGLVAGVNITDQGKFRVRVYLAGSIVYFGTFKTKEQANIMAISKRKEFHKEFAFENRPLNRRF